MGKMVDKNKLRKAIKDRGYTLARASREIGAFDGYFSCILTPSSKNVISDRYMNRIASKLHIPYSEIRYGDSEQTDISKKDIEDIVKKCISDALKSDNTYRILMEIIRDIFTEIL